MASIAGLALVFVAGASAHALQGSELQPKTYVSPSGDWTLRVEPTERIVRDGAALSGRIDILVNNAGIIRRADALEFTEKDWDAVVSAARDPVRQKAKDKAAGAAAQVALFEMEQRRYRSEATLNQEVGFLYEARVKITTAESDRHRKKSQQFFYAMLAAQIGATISALALAKKTGSALWLFAGIVGLASVGIGAYVFLE